MVGWEPTSAELLDDAQQHGRRVADYVADKIQTESIDRSVATKLLHAFVGNYVQDMLAQGASRRDVAAWVRAVQGAFRARLAEAQRVERDDLRRPARGI